MQNTRRGSASQSTHTTHQADWEQISAKAGKGKQGWHLLRCSDNSNTHDRQELIMLSACCRGLSGVQYWAGDQAESDGFTTWCVNSPAEGSESVQVKLFSMHQLFRSLYKIYCLSSCRHLLLKRDVDSAKIYYKKKQMHSVLLTFIISTFVCCTVQFGFIYHELVSCNSSGKMGFNQSVFKVKSISAYTLEKM